MLSQLEATLPQTRTSHSTLRLVDIWLRDLPCAGAGLTPCVMPESLRPSTQETQHVSMSVSVEQVARGCSGAYQEDLTRECRTSTRAGITNESIRGSRSGLVIFLTECLKQCSQSLEGSALPHIQLVKLVDVDSSFIKHMVSAHLYIPVLEQHTSTSNYDLQLFFWQHIPGFILVPFVPGVGVSLSKELQEGLLHHGLAL